MMGKHKSISPPALLYRPLLGPAVVQGAPAFCTQE